jgi:glycosyltransferase involved in cell wall biosynthesis
MRDSDVVATIRGLRIAHLIETDGPGGAERMFAALAGQLAARGCPGIAFLPEGKEGWLGRELASVGVAVEYFRLTHPVSPRCARDLAASLRRHRIDLAHSHEFTMAVYGGVAARLANVPHITTMHGSRYYAARWQRRLAMRFAARADSSLVAVSNQLAASLRADLHFAPERVTVIPNGVSPTPAVTPTLKEELGLSANDRLLVSVGNLYAVKGHRFLIDALALLASAHPTTHVAIAGRGDLATALTEQANALHVSNRVHLLGLRSDIPNVLAAADVFVLPSLSEGLPLALLEGMFAARPIVATDVGEVRTVLGSDSGIVVPPGDAAALAAAIGALLRDPARARQLGARALARAAEEYGLDRMVDRYAALYAGLRPRTHAA